jgi:hypothetical protein
MELKAVPSAKSLVLVVRAPPPGKTSSSPAAGATLSTQLAAVIQLLSMLLPPSQTRVAKRMRRSSASVPGRVLRSPSRLEGRARYRTPHLPPKAKLISDPSCCRRLKILVSTECYPPALLDATPIR